MLTYIGHWIWNWVIGWGGIGSVVAIAAWLLWYFTPAFLLKFKSLLLHIAIGATVFVIASGYFFNSGYSSGYATAINAIAKKDQAAVARVKGATDKIDQCENLGGSWDVTSGQCDR